MVAIERNVPIPTMKMNKYPYDQMDIGDSFWVEGKDVQVMRTLCCKHGKALGMRFIARTEGEGVRVWRVE